MRARSLALASLLPCLALAAPQALAQPAPTAAAAPSAGPSTAPAAAPAPSASATVAADPPPLAAPSQEDRDRANELMDEGDALTEKGDHASALAAYQKADALMRVPTTGIEVARSLDRLGKLTAALAAARAVASTPASPNEPKPFAEARDRASALAAALEARVPTLTVVIKVASNAARADVTLDGKKLSPADLAAPLLLDPGTYRLVATAPEHTAATVEVVLKERDRAQAALALARILEAPRPLPTIKPPPPPGLSPFVPAGFSIAAAGVVIGSITGALAISTANDANNLCPGGRCPLESTRQKAEAAYGSADALAILSDVSFLLALGGGVMGIYGVATTVSAPSPAPPAAISRPQLFIGPSSVAARFTF